MTTPAFVIHGIGNRDADDFGRTVTALARAVGGDLAAHPVFWGDLGARYAWITNTIPGVPADGTEIRDRDVDGDPQAAALARLLLGTSEGDEIRDGSVPEATLEAATSALGTDDGDEIRDDADPAGAAAVRAAIEEHWPETAWLPLIDERDDELLRAIGAAVAEPLAEDAVHASSDGEEIRDGYDETELRALDVGGFVRRRLHEVDRVVGAAFGAAGGRLNRQLRTTFLPNVTRGVGDILVYQRHRDEIRQRVREVIADVDPELGRSPQRPVDVVAHSLGGVIAVDIATGDDPLWIRNLVTFGSQSPFFHVCDPRGGLLAPYTGGGPVSLPESIGAWTNLWEPLDPVAFIAAKVFRLHDGSPPKDLEVPHLASSGLWTHSGYWTLRDVAVAIRTALNGAAPGR